MKFGFRTPSLKRRIAARTSLKRYVRHSMGLKMPRGYGFITNPKRALYNKVYRKTTFGIDDTARGSKSASSGRRSYQSQLITNSTPIAYDQPFSIHPRSFIQIINEKDSFGKDGWATLLTIGGIIFLIPNPILGIPLLLGGGYWLYKITKQPWYKEKQAISKAKKLIKSEKYEESLPKLEEAIGIDGSNDKTSYMLGTVLHATGKYEESIKPLNKYTDSNPSDLDAKLVLAYSLYKLNKFKESASLLQQFPQDYPDYIMVILLLGDSFACLKEYDMAIEVLKRGPVLKRNLDPALMQLHYLLGKTYMEKGDKKNAMKHLKKVYSVDMSYRDVAQRIEEMEGESKHE